MKAAAQSYPRAEFQKSDATIGAIPGSMSELNCSESAETKVLVLLVDDDRFRELVGLSLT
jgi:hypothetical protein